MGISNSINSIKKVFNQTYNISWGKVIDLTFLANNDLKIIIVPKVKHDTKWGGMEVDDIVRHTAFSFYNVSKKLGKKPSVQILNKCKITQDDKIVILCGHGNPEYFTIQNRQLDDIAKLLVKNGYTNQLVYITSCDSNTLSTCQDGLGRSTIALILTAMLTNANDNKYLGQVKVYSDADGSSITCTDGDSSELKIYVLKAPLTVYNMFKQTIKKFNHADKLPKKRSKILHRLLTWRSRRYELINKEKRDLLKVLGIELAFNNEPSNIISDSTNNNQQQIDK